MGSLTKAGGIRKSIIFAQWSFCRACQVLNGAGRTSCGFALCIDELTQGFESSRVYYSPALAPADYELLVADKLADSGWSARATGATGDQGIDVIATKHGAKLVVQCKLYSQPVGNDAVQEVIAGREFEQASYAAVVSNTEFTRAARQLASSARVLLLHHDQLVQIDSLLGLDDSIE
jgi:restriction endonuclease Mrr